MPNLENSKYTIPSISKLYLYRLIKGIRGYDNVIKCLTDNEKDAFLIGFFKNGLNNLDLPPSRTFRHYLQNYLNTKIILELDSLAEFILLEATNQNIILDVEIVNRAIKEKKKTNDTEIREAVKLIKKLVYPQIGLKIKSNGKFTSKDLLDVLVHTALTSDFVNNGSQTFKLGNEKNCPSGDLMMYHFSKFDSIWKIRKTFEKILDFIFNFMRSNYNFLKSRKVNLAYDIHKIAFYGKNMPFVCGDKFENGTSDFLKFLTCSVILSGQRFILDVIPISPLDDIPKLLDESLARVKNKVRINQICLDRGFNSSNFIKTLKKHKVKFLMPMIRNPSVKAIFEKAEGVSSYVFKDFKIKDEAVNLVLVNDEVGIKRAFISNFDVSPILAHRLYNEYSMRWGIESGYRILANDFRAKTTSKNYHIRLFYFLFSTCLYNLWVLVNICVSLSVYGRIKDKPVITTKMFGVLLYKIQIEYCDSG